MYKKIIFIAFLIFIGLTLNWIYYHIFSNTGSIEKATKIELPYWTKTVETHDNWEFAVVGKYILPKRSIVEFCAEYELLDNCQTMDCDFQFDEYLKEKNRIHMDNSSDFLYLQDCKKYNTWEVLVNKETGELWISVSYPDMSGDHFDCGD